MKKFFLIVSSFAVLMTTFTSCDKSAAASREGSSGTEWFMPLAEFQSASEGPTVYICTGPNSKRYHRSSDCRGLKKCSGSIRAVSVSKAESMRRTPCKWCYE